jgi:3-hydroxyisobutyrate dehydrogenase
MSAFKKIAFIGIGNMGWPMAARLVGAKFNVAVCDVTPGRAEKFAAEIGGEGAPDAAAAAEGADAVITILPTSKHVAGVIAAIRGKLKFGTLVIEMSSGIPSVTQSLAAALAEDGIEMVDAPVSGGVSRAKTGELAIMTGGADAALERAAPLLAAMGTTITPVGPILRRRFFDRNRGFADRQKVWPGCGENGRCAECLDRHEQQHAKEIQAVRAVAQIRQQFWT